MHTFRPSFLSWPGTGLVLLASSVAAAAPPTVTRLSPQGAEHGKPVEIVITGTNLTLRTRLVLPFAATQTLLPDAKPAPTQVRLRLTVAAQVPAGIYPVRVLNEEGLSAPRLFSVDALPSVAEKEDNNVPERAQKVTPPVIVDGQCPGGDVDWFRFSAHKGQRLLLEVVAARLGSALLPQLRLTDDRLRFLAADDTQALHGDARIAFVAPADGDYLLELSDTRYRGGNPAHYRLVLADADALDEVFPLGWQRGQPAAFALRGGTLAGDLTAVRTLEDPLREGTALLPLEGLLRPGLPSPRLAVGDFPERIWVKTGLRDPKSLDVLPPLTINSRMERPGDRDLFQLAVTPGERYRFTVEAESLGSRLDAVLRLSDQADRQLALVDDVDLPVTPGQPPLRSVDPVLDFTVPAGVSLLRVEVHDQLRRGGLNYGYRLTIEPAADDFAVTIPVTEINVPRGGSAVLTVPVQRRGYLGPLRLTMPDLPPGLTFQGGHVSAGAPAGVLTVSAAANLAPSATPLSLALEGRATLAGGKELRHQGSHRFFLNREASSSTLTFTRLALGLTPPEPFAVMAAAGATPLPVVLGYPTPVPVAINRAKEQASLAVQVTGVDPRAVPPPGQPPPPAVFTFQPSAAVPGTGASFTLTPALTAAVGTLDLVVEGKAKVGPAERKVLGPALTVEVRRPFEVQLAQPLLTLVPAQTVPLLVKVVRQPVCKEAVQLKLDGLPAGVTLAAPLAPLPSDRADATINLQADPKIQPGRLNLSLTCSATIAGMAYKHPPVLVPAEVSKK